MKIAVLCGGLSNERDVSVASGTGIASALREKGHRCALVDLFFGCSDTDADIDDLFTCDDGKAFLVGESAPDLDAVRALRPGQGLVGPRVMDICKAADIVFLALHGDDGENGKLQAYLDLNGIRYTGSGYLGSAVAMNKSVSKDLLRQAGIDVPEGITLNRGEDNNVGFPCVVKPCSGGSSVGTTIVKTAADYTAALELAFHYEDSVLVERFVKGRELTVGILDGCAMPVIEIIPKMGFYDYKNKYQPGMTLELCPAPLSEEETKRVQTVAERAFKALRMEAYGRVDVIMDEDGVCRVLEANTLPGMTCTSLVPQMGTAMGLDFGTLCERLIYASMKKYKREVR